jgi:hypothetical protein
MMRRAARCTLQMINLRLVWPSSAERCPSRLGTVVIIGDRGYFSPATLNCGIFVVPAGGKPPAPSGAVTLPTVCVIAPYALAR